MYPGWQIRQNDSGPLCGGIFWTAGGRRLHSLARPRVGMMVEMRMSEAKMAEARMAGTAVAVKRVRGVVTLVLQQRYRPREQTRMGHVQLHPE